MENILELNQVSKAYPKSDFTLDSLSLSLPYGAILGFVGENGAGKTTTIDCILNTVRKDSGKEGSMKGLLRNNLLAAFSNGIVFSVFLLLWGIFIMVFPDRNLFIGFGVSGMVGFSANGIFSVQRESSSRWGKYKLTAPVRRADIVKSYYIAQLVWLFWGILFAAAASVLSTRVFRRWAFDLYTDLPMFALGISVSLFLCAIFFPLFCWSREDRGEVFLVIALLCAIAVDAGLVMLLNMILSEPGRSPYCAALRP